MRPNNYFQPEGESLEESWRRRKQGNTNTSPIHSMVDNFIISRSKHDHLYHLNMTRFFQTSFANSLGALPACSVKMRLLLIVSFGFLSAEICQGQIYNKGKVCGTDTIQVNYRDLKMGDRINYKAFKCIQASKTGIRINLGFSSFSYYGGTKEWIGNHNAGVFGLCLVYGKFNLGLNFKLTTVTPGSKLVFSNDTLTQAAKLNPIKDDFYVGFSLDLKNNFSVEPHVGLTKNLFYVINEKDLNKSFDIPGIYGLNSGLTFNKYFKLKDFQFIAAFLSYSYGFTNFKKINPQLGKGYSEWSIGLSYKMFGKRNFLERIN